MENKKTVIYKNELTFLDLLRIFISKKWWFIGSFIIFLIAIFTYFIFLKSENPAMYSAAAQIKLDNVYIGLDNDSLYSYFPEDSEKQWIFPYALRGAMENDKLFVIASELESEEFLIIVANALNLDYSVTTTDLRNSIDIVRSIDKKSLIVNVARTDKNTAQTILQTVTDSYLSWKSMEFENNYTDFLTKLSLTLDKSSKTITDLTYEREKNSQELRLETIKPLEAQNSDTIIEKRKEVNYLDRQLTTKYKEYELFERLNNNFIQNKDFYINKIQVIGNPQTNVVSPGDSLTKNILFSLLISLALALLVTYIVGLASYARKTYK